MVNLLRPSRPAKFFKPANNFLPFSNIAPTVNCFFKPFHALVNILEIQSVLKPPGQTDFKYFCMAPQPGKFSNTFSLMNFFKLFKTSVGLNCILPSILNSFPNSLKCAFARNMKSEASKLNSNNNSSMKNNLFIAFPAALDD